LFKAFHLIASHEKLALIRGQSGRLRCHVKDEAVDLVDLDRLSIQTKTITLLFAEEGRTDAAAQFRALGTWEWNHDSASTYEELVERAEGFQTFCKRSASSERMDMLAYLTMMAPRLGKLHRKLKPTGSYLIATPQRVITENALDAIFGGQELLNEIMGRRTTTKNDYVKAQRNWPDPRRSTWLWQGCS